MQNTQLPLLQRPGKSRTVLIAGAIALSHLAVGTVAFYAGVEHMRSQMLKNLDLMEQQLEKNFNEAFGLEPESNYEPQSFRLSGSQAYLDETQYAQLGTDETPEGEPIICWGGEPCESATVPGVYYLHTRRGAGTESGPAVWPLPETDGCESQTEVVCEDGATGFMYSYWKGVYTWQNLNAEVTGTPEFGTQRWDDSAGLAHPQS